mgnify:CR=1 FL=1
MNALLKKAIAEFLGVAGFLAAIISSTTIAGGARAGGFANLALGATLGLMILLTAGTSGGHLNPAVSLYFLAKRGISLTDFITYVVAQLAGAAVGVQIGFALAGTSAGAAVATAPATDILAEFVTTTVLVWIVGHLAATDQGSKIPFAVGLWVVAASLYTTSGAQANPAVTFGLLFNGHSVTYVGTVILAQVIGVLCALVLVMFVTGPAAKKAAKKK